MSTINMEHIARLAGVSRTTVSRVLRAPHLVQPATRDKVTSILHQYKYVYHSAAADLSRRKTSIIGLILPTVKTLAFADTILAVQQAATDMGMTIMLGSSQYDTNKEAYLLQQFHSRRLSGLVLLGHTKEMEKRVEEIHRGGTPCVVIWTTPSNVLLNEVGFDNILAGYNAVTYLLDMGHTKIAIVTGPRGAGHRVVQRLHGYKKALQEYGIPVRHEYIKTGMPDINVGEQTLREFMELPSPPTAIFATSDMLAIGTLNAARGLGMRVPEDLSVVGFDNVDFAAHTNPPLTTVAVPAGPMARIAVGILRDLQFTSPPPVHHVLPTHLVIRKSCAPPKHYS